MIFSALDDDDYVLDVSQGNKDKYQMILYKKNNGKNQLFYIKSAGPNFPNKYYLESALGATVEVPNDSTENEVQLLAGQKNSSKNEMWEIYPSQNQKGYHIRSFCGKVLDVSGCKAKNGQPIIQYDFNGGKNQTWVFRPVWFVDWPLWNLFK